MSCERDRSSLPIPCGPRMRACATLVPAGPASATVRSIEDSTRVPATGVMRLARRRSAAFAPASNASGEPRRADSWRRPAAPAPRPRRARARWSRTGPRRQAPRARPATARSRAVRRRPARAAGAGARPGKGGPAARAPPVRAPPAPPRSRRRWRRRARTPPRGAPRSPRATRAGGAAGPNDCAAPSARSTRCRSPRPDGRRPALRR